VLRLAALGAAFLFSAAHADDPPTSLFAKLSADAKAVGETVKRDAKLVAVAAKNGAARVTGAAKETAQNTAASAKEGANQVAATARQGGERTKAAAKGDKPDQSSDKPAKLDPTKLDGLPVN
jgi:hypothetical protein